MGFLPRRRGQSFGGFRSRPRFRTQRFMGTLRRPIRSGLIESGGISAISFGTTLNIPLITASDSPDKTSICNVQTGGTSITVENSARILKKGSFINLTFTASADGTLAGVWVYNNEHARVSPPTDTTDFNEGPQVEDNIVLRQHTIYYKRFVINAGEERHLRIPLASRKLKYMKDNSILRLVLQNFQPAAGNLNYSAYGRARILE